MGQKKGGFSGSIGFVLAAAGSAVGVGNIWRFPYLAAKDGGGLFIVVYLALVMTFGFTLLTTDIALGRRTKQNALRAFGSIRKNWDFLGKLTFLVPAMIMTYYTVMATEQGPQEAILKELSRHEPRNQQAISMELCSDESWCSTGNNQARDQAGITQLSWKLSSR